MKSFIAAMIITLIMVGGSMFYTSHLSKLSQQLTEESSAAEQCLYGDDFEKATEHIDKIVECVDKKKLTLSATLDHSELDRIESTLSELRTYTACQNKTDALAKAGALKLYLEHLPKNYKLKIENIL